MNIFPEISLTKTEEDIVIQQMSHPVVVKYLHMLAYNKGTEIVTNALVIGQNPEEYLRVLASTQGQLAAINTLLELSKVAEQQPSE